MRISKQNILLLAFVWFSFVQLVTAEEGSGEFRAGVVKIDITPDKPQWLEGYGARQSTGINDRIYHRILALDDGKKQFFIISTELCVISPSDYDRIAAILKDQFGIDRENVWWTVTHTHSAPEIGAPGMPAVFMGDRYQHDSNPDYTEMVIQKLVEGIDEARQKLISARLGVGWGFSQANINRRAIDVDGKASLGLNPDGSVDRRIGLLRIDKQDGTPLALVANYPIHGTVLGPSNLKISGDAPGVVSEYVEQKIGAPVLFINGAAGNIAPIYSVYLNPEEGHLGQFRVLLGDRIIEANKRILGTTDQITLRTGALTVETPRKEGLGWPEDLKKYARTTKSGTNLIRLPVSFLKINDEITIWSAPLELFCEISNEIRDQSPFPYTFYFGYANGWLGYLPSQTAWEKGGYEVDTASPFTPKASKDFKDRVIDYLKKKM